MSVLSRTMNNLPLAPIPAVVYWDERVNGWWTGLDRICPVKDCGGRLHPVPPDAYAKGPGDISCLNCGRFTSEIQQSRVIRRPLTATEITPPRGRPRDARHPCRDCGASILKANVRCRDCNDEHRTSIALAMRIVLLLHERGPLQAGELSDILKTDPDTLRHGIAKARKAGHSIRKDARGYRMEATS